MDIECLLEANAPVGILLVSLETGQIVLVNSRAEQLYGYAAEQLIGREIFDLVVDAQSLRQRMEQALSDGLGVAHRSVHRRADGSLLSVSVAMGVCRQPEEIFLIKYVLDASSIQQTEQKLEESLFRFKAVADYTYDWESWLDLSGRLVWVNPAVERLAGFTVRECLEMTDYPLPIVCEEDRPKVMQLLASALQGSSGNDVEFRIQSRMGQLRWMAVSWQTLRDFSNRSVGVRMSMRDIDDRKGMEQQLREYNTELEKMVVHRAAQIIDLETERNRIQRLASLGKLAAAVAHEINNPLAGIKNAFQLLHSESSATGEQEELWDLIGKEIERMSRVLQQMTQLYRPSIEPAQRLEVQVVVRQLLTLLRGEMEARRLQVDLLDGNRSWIAVVPDICLRQILHNLLLNAMEACEANGRIEVRLSEVLSGQIAVTVRDYGPGLDSEVVQRVFEPFFTTKNEAKRPGSGLGLAISRSLANAVGARLDVEPCEGPGAAFRLTLPKDVRLLSGEESL